MIRHITCNIDFLLKQTDEYLSKIFECNGSEVRQELLDRKANGELKIGSEGCIGFCSINGCPGHEN